MKVYSVLYGDSAHLDKYGTLKTVRHPSEMDSSQGILLIHGGADISPALYGHKISKYSQAHLTPSARDITELMCIKKAVKLGIPIFGICRGAQLLCAVAGGSLIQHTDGHTSGSHMIETDDGLSLKTTTCHHQMMDIRGTDHVLKAWASPSRSSFYLHQNDIKTDLEKEPEIVIFPKIKALAVQGHPEWMSANSPLVEYCNSLLEKELF